jgi:hypothetical protein
MLKRITVENVSLTGESERSFAIIVYAKDFENELPENLGGMLQIADAHASDPLAEASLKDAAVILANRLTVDTGRQWTPEEVVKRGASD